MEMLLHFQSHDKLSLLLLYRDGITEPSAKARLRLDNFSGSPTIKCLSDPPDWALSMRHIDDHPHLNCGICMAGCNLQKLVCKCVRVVCMAAAFPDGACRVCRTHKY